MRGLRRAGRGRTVARPTGLDPHDLPNGRSIVLERQPGADAAGYSGLDDEVDNRWATLFKAAFLSTLLGVGSELGCSRRNASAVQR
jgi:type IV secretory pathway VirB10-like protein